MRRISENKPQSIDWNKEIDVRVSLKELALIYAHLAKSDRGKDREVVDRKLGVGEYSRITVGDDIGLNVYVDSYDILREEGAIE